MGFLSFLSGSPGVGKVQKAVKKNVETTQKQVTEGVTAKREQVGETVDKDIAALRESFQPSLEGIQRGLLSSQEQGRGALVSNLARLGVRSGGAAKRIGQFESGATADLARSEFGSKLQLEDFLSRVGQVKRGQLLGDISAADAAAQGVQLTSGTGDFIKSLAGPVLGSLAGRFLNPIGAAAGAGLERAGKGVAKGIFGDRGVQPGQIA